MILFIVLHAGVSGRKYMRCLFPHPHEAVKSRGILFAKNLFSANKFLLLLGIFT